MSSSILSTSISRYCIRSKATNSTLFTSGLRKMSTGVPSSTAAAQQAANISAPSTSELGIENTNVKTAAGVELSAQQKLLVGSVLDVSHTFPQQNQNISPTRKNKLFAGRPSLKKLQLWTVSLFHLALLPTANIPTGRRNIQRPSNQSSRPQTIPSPMVRPAIRVLRN